MNAKQIEQIQRVSDHIEGREGRHNELLVICGNDETISQAVTDYEDMEAAGMDIDEVGSAWFDCLRSRMNAAGIANLSYRVETSFAYYHGGPGGGLVKVRDHDEVGSLREPLEALVSECLKGAQADIDEYMVRCAAKIAE